MALQTELSLSVSSLFTGAIGSTTKTQNLAYQFVASLLDGIGEGHSNIMTQWSYTFAPSESKEWVLGSGCTLLDPFGQLVRFRAVRLFIMRSYSTSPQKGITIEKTTADTRFLFVNNGDSAGLFALRPGGVILLFGPDSLSYDIDQATAVLGFKATNKDTASKQLVDFLVIGESH